MTSTDCHRSDSTLSMVVKLNHVVKFVADELAKESSVDKLVIVFLQYFFMQNLFKKIRTVCFLFHCLGKNMSCNLFDVYD